MTKEEAKRRMAEGKPVAALVWPQIFEGKIVAQDGDTFTVQSDVYRITGVPAEKLSAKPD